MNSLDGSYTCSWTHFSQRCALDAVSLLSSILNDLKWPPLKFRLACTSVLQHLGGIHSGCATSGLLWLFFKVVVILKEHKKNLNSTLVMGVLTNIVIAVSIASAIPWVRNTHHKSAAVSHRLVANSWLISSSVFERHHRFMGWCVNIPPNFSSTALLIICYCSRLGLFFSELTVINQKVMEINFIVFQHGSSLYSGTVIIWKPIHGTRTLCITSNSKIFGLCSAWPFCELSFNLISMNNAANYMLFIFIPSVLLPWFTVRQVKVDIEIVRLLWLFF